MSVCRISRICQKLIDTVSLDDIIHDVKSQQNQIMGNECFPEERKVTMLTIQSFLLKFRNLRISKEIKKNLKYALLIVVYAFIAVIVVLKFNVFQMSSEKKSLEAFAAQKIAVVKEETPVLNEMSYLNLAFYNSSNLRQSINLKPLQTITGQVPLISADFYAGDMVLNTVASKKVENEVSKSAAKEEVAEDAKETMNTGVAKISLSSKEIEILQRIVEAEATGEDIKGKILVANVIINRVNDSAFPDSVEEVVFQKTGGTYQFSPISDKRYYSVSISDETKDAVQRVLQGEDYSQGALYFSARKRASASNMRWFDNNLQWLFQYGNHEFFKHK